MAKPDPDLVALRERWSPAWKIWRARLVDDPPGRRRGSYCASLMDHAAGVTPFLMTRNPQHLHDALDAQAVAVAAHKTTAPEPPLFP